MKRLWIVGAAIALTLGSVTACGDDDEDDTGGTGGSGGTATGGTGGGETGGTGGGGTGGGETGGEAGMGGEGGLPATMCDPTGDGACENEDDCAVVESGDAAEKSRLCGISCVADSDPEACSTDCINMQAGLSEECSGCYAVLAGCSIENCLVECGADAESAACLECQSDNCFADFEDCSGLNVGN